ncbi:hypothetical protein BDR26DRAFT_242074 [Obelidium mucronatum]|nr:hypothetical protein BDR26DRAFT_242074 [Obelidium mucronatum]
MSGRAWLALTCLRPDLTERRRPASLSAGQLPLRRRLRADALAPEAAAAARRAAAAARVCGRRAADADGLLRRLRPDAARRPIRSQLRGRAVARRLRRRRRAAESKRRQGKRNAWFIGPPRSTGQSILPRTPSPHSTRLSSWTTNSMMAIPTANCLMMMAMMTMTIMALTMTIF